MPDDDRPPSRPWAFLVLALAGIVGVVAGCSMVGAASASTHGVEIPRNPELWVGFVLLGAVAGVGLLGWLFEKKAKAAEGYHNR